MRSPTAVVVLVVIALVAVACYDVRPPAVPSAERVPTLIGQIVGGVPGQSFELANGETVAVRDATGVSLREQLGPDGGYLPQANGPDGSVLLTGEDSRGKFFATTRPPEDGCFRIFGPGYLQADRNRIHLSTGLVLELAAEYERTNDRYPTDPSWLLDSDRICLDESGHVRLIHQVPLGA